MKIIAANQSGILPIAKLNPQKRDGTGMKVLFINPPSVPYAHLVRGLADSYSSIHQNVAMPMGILYLSSMLEERLPGIEIQVIDLALAVNEYCKGAHRQPVNIEGLTSMQFDKLPKGYEPSFVGISILFSTAHRSSIHIADSVKQRWPSVPVVIGGMHATNAVESLLESPSVDYVCRGEGEAIISDFATLLAKGESVESLPGIVGRKKLGADKDASLSETVPVIDDLDEIPLPSWHLLPMEHYIACDDSRSRELDMVDQAPRIATIVTTRGCPFKCTFCASWTVHGRAMRYRSIDNVLKELTLLREKFKVNIVIPEDDLFSVDKKRIVPLCNAVAEKFNRAIQFQFPSGLSVATLDRDVIRAMINMGMTVANIAIESGSPYVQKHIIKKNCNLERARNVVQICRDEGIFVRAYFVMGFPGETKEMLQETINFLQTLSTDWNVINVAAPLIGTEMYEQMMDKGWIDDSFNWDEAFFQERTFDTTEVTATELKEIAYTGNITYNFFENYNYRTGDYDRAISLFQDILRAHKAHLIAQYCIGRCYKAKGDLEAYEASLLACREMIEKGYSTTLEHMNNYGDRMPELANFVNPKREIAV
jgi:anaerobic magnesium-protoporphyrin IX monomethyl ester cyclase